MIEEKRKGFYVTTSKGGAGWFAVMIVRDPDGFEEPYQTGFGGYLTQGEAENEARNWAEMEELSFIEA